MNNDTITIIYVGIDLVSIIIESGNVCIYACMICHIFHATLQKQIYYCNKWKIGIYVVVTNRLFIIYIFNLLKINIVMSIKL